MLKKKSNLSFKVDMSCTIEALKQLRHSAVVFLTEFALWILTLAT